MNDPSLSLDETQNAILNFVITGIQVRTPVVGPDAAREEMASYLDQIAYNLRTDLNPDPSTESNES